MDSILIVVPTYSHFDYAEVAIKSALDNTTHLNASVVVVDDASPDWSQAWIDRVAGDYGDRVFHLRYDVNGGLTRSWNEGLRIAKGNWTSLHEKILPAFDYCCVTNSDVIFAPGWDRDIVLGLEKFDLVGPLTNCPGTEMTQYVGKYSLTYRRKNSSEADIAVVQAELHKAQAQRFRENDLNGFCLVAKTKTWWDNAFDKDNVFRPRNDFNSKGQPNPTPLMTLNEYELQQRWTKAGRKTGICLGSYVFHWRAVTRGDKFKKGDWARLGGES